MLQEMQDRAVCHADIKTENIIVGYDGKMTLIDFGLSLIDGVQMFPGAGTLHFMPPEAKRPVPHITPKADIFAVGQTLEVLVESLCDPDSNTPEMVDFIKRCTHPNMKCRADLRELQQVSSPSCLSIDYVKAVADKHVFVMSSARLCPKVLWR